MVVTSTNARRCRPRWLVGPLHDGALGLLWAPFAVAALAFDGDPERLRWLVAATLTFSFAHQPLTLWLVYGDARQRGAHPSLFTWSPPAAALVIGALLALNPAVVALVAGAWNLAHTLRQRYGIVRLYGRRSGHDRGALDNLLLWSWLGLAVVMAAARTDLAATAAAAGVGGRTPAALGPLVDARPLVGLLLPAAAAFALVTSVRWVREERRQPEVNPARWFYLASTAALLGTLAVEPVVGFVGYVGAHAAEYLLVVRWRLRRAATAPPTGGDHVGALARRTGPSGTLGLYAAAMAVLLIGLDRFAGAPATSVTVLVLGGLHLFYDGFIWHSRPAEPSPSPSTRPEVLVP